MKKIGMASDGMAAAVKPAWITEGMARKVMEAVDGATNEALAAMGLEAFRFDASIYGEEQWLLLKIKIRPVSRRA